MKLAYLFLTLMSVLLLPSGCATHSEGEISSPDISRLAPKARKGNAEAQYELGVAYAQIWKFAEANQWFRKAAEQGVADAQYRLAVNYSNGEGVPKDVVEAYAWFNLAAAQDHRLAMNAREQLSRKLSRAEIDEANQRASDYVAKIAARSRKRPAPAPAKPLTVTNAPSATSTTNAPGK